MLVKTSGFRFKNGTNVPAQVLRSPQELKALLEPICGMRKAGETNGPELMAFARTFESNGVPFAKFGLDVQKAVLDGKLYYAMADSAEGHRKVPVILHQTTRGGHMELNHEANGRGADFTSGFFMLTDPECVGRRGGCVMLGSSSMLVSSLFEAERTGREQTGK